VTDITAERERDAAIRDSEAQLRLLADSMPVLISFVDSDLRYRFVNRAYESWFGLSRDEVLGRRIDELLGTDAMAARIEPAKRALSGEAQSFETFTPRADGARRITELQYIPRLADNGRPDGFFVFATDITERKMLLEELHHRVKNTLAIVQALARQSFKSLPDANGALESFEHRLEALSSAHSILTHQSWEAASIRELVNSSIAPYQTRASAFDATGPDFKVDSNTAVGLALTLNELATNAVKHGALTSPNGSVAISWQLENSHMELVWRESGGPPVTPPTKRGFGTRMIERGLASKLRAAVKIEFEPDGLVCTLAAPVAQLPQEAA
jgi:PAS domain S-box-containing protein